MLGTYKEQIDLTGFNSLLHRKCAARDVDFAGLDDFFYDYMLSYVAGTWDRSLGLLVLELPPFETIVGELRPHVAALLSADR